MRKDLFYQKHGQLTKEQVDIKWRTYQDDLLYEAMQQASRFNAASNLGGTQTIQGPNPSITLLTPVIDFNVPEITIPFTYNSPLGKYIVLVSTDNGASFIENTNVGQCNLNAAAVFPIGPTGIPVGSLLIKFKSVDNPVIESLPISAITINTNDNQLTTLNNVQLTTLDNNPITTFNN